MGYGDDILASGYARGAWKRGKRVAFGDGNRIIWGPWSKEIFRHNKNVAEPGSEGSPDLEWCDFYKGHRNYNHLHPDGSRWVWNMNFHARPGELYFGADELAEALKLHTGFVLIEPNVPQQKSVKVNKQWPFDRWQKVADLLMAANLHVVQLVYPGALYRLDGVHHVRCENFRMACAILSRAALFIGHEGGMHHAAAALDIPGVVIFGGFIPPQVTGYPLHHNLTGLDTIACGSLHKCDHCAACMEAITVDEVMFYAIKSVVTDEPRAS